jgi:hypothetical protein
MGASSMNCKHAAQSTSQAFMTQEQWVEISIRKCDDTVLMSTRVYDSVEFVQTVMSLLPALSSGMAEYMVCMAYSTSGLIAHVASCNASWSSNVPPPRTDGRDLYRTHACFGESPSCTALNASVAYLEVDLPKWLLIVYTSHMKLIVSGLSVRHEL